MLGDITQAKNVYIVCGRTDMRKGIRGLAALVQQNYQMDPTDSSLFLFCGKSRSQLKALLWEPDGFILLSKQLSNGRCCPAGWPIRANEQFGGEKCETICDVAPELLVLRYGKRGNVQCFVFQHDRNSKGKQFGSIWISAVFAPGAAQTGRKA